MTIESIRTTQSPTLLVLLCSLFIAISCNESESRSNNATQSGDSNTLLVRATSLNLRSEPSTSASVEYSAHFLEPLWRSSEQERSDGSRRWWQLQNQRGEEGWADSSFLVATASEDLFDTSEKIIDERLAAEPGYRDLVSFLRGIDQLRRSQPADASGNWRDSEVGAEEFWFYLLVRIAAGFAKLTDQQYLEAMQHGKRNLAGIETLHYDEISGSWLVAIEPIWSRVENAAITLPLRDELAYLAATLPRGGECEGDVPCHIGRLRYQEFRYLKLMERGRYREEMEKRILSDIEAILDLPFQPFHSAGSHEEIRIALEEMRREIMAMGMNDLRQRIEVIENRYYARIDK